MVSEKIKILFVEDDENLGLVVKDFLESKGYDIILVKDGISGEKEYKKGKYNLCIFDVMLPKQDGFTLAKNIRKKDDEIPIIFLTAKSQSEDKIIGFKTGADDYITKPFSTEELNYRIKAVLKRTTKLRNNNSYEKEIYKIGKYIFDFTNLSLNINNTSKTITIKEAELLKLLYLNKNIILTRATALKTIWGEDDYFMGRSMDVFITRMRKYLKEDTNIKIQNIHGAGYKFIVDGN